MWNAAKSMLVAVALGASGLAIVAGVRPVPGSRSDRALTAIRESGQIYLAGRELHVDLDFPGGKSGRGKLFVLFEPSTGLFFQTSGWERSDYPSYPWMDNLKAHSRVGVTSDRLLIVSVGKAVVIVESVEKANSLDDAEGRSLKWIGDHLTDVEARSPGSLRAISLRFDPFEFPKGFIRVHDSTPFRSVRLADMTWQGGEWDLTIENADTQQKAQVRILRAGDTWSKRPVRPVP